MKAVIKNVAGVSVGMVGGELAGEALQRSIAGSPYIPAAGLALVGGYFATKGGGLMRQVGLGLAANAVLHVVSGFLPTQRSAFDFSAF
jgi:hypothetical protein